MRGAKIRYLTQWANSIQKAVYDGKLGRTRQQLAISLVPGPRAGGLDIYAPADPASLKKSLNEAGGLTVANLVPWHFSQGYISTYSHGKIIRVEAAWPDELSEANVPLKSVSTLASKHLHDSWIAGQDENGLTVQPGFYLSPHWLIAGETGGGKTVAIKSIIGQLAQHGQGRTKFVLIDGKRGEGLGALSHIPNLIGPLAYDPDLAARALSWVLGEMNNRYNQLRECSETERSEWMKNTPRLVVVVDEIQTLTFDPLIARAIAILLQQGRAAKVNLMVSTQHPTNNILGDNTMKTNLGGRIALKVNSMDTSRVVLGTSEPDATKLLGKGDAYVSAGGLTVRTQIAYMTPGELRDLKGDAPVMEEWPEAEREVDFASERLSVADPEAIAQAVLSAAHGEGRPAMQTRLKSAGLPVPGTTKSIALLGIGRKIWEILSQNGLTAD